MAPRTNLGGAIEEKGHVMSRSMDEVWTAVAQVWTAVAHRGRHCPCPPHSSAGPWAEGAPLHDLGSRVGFMLGFRVDVSQRRASSPCLAACTASSYDTGEMR